MNVLIADIETNGFLEDLDTLWCIAVGDAKTDEITLYAYRPGYESLASGVDRLCKADRVVFHNGVGFDHPALERFFPGRLDIEKVYDSLLVSRLLDPSRGGGHALEDWGRRLGSPKGSHSDFSRWSEEMGRYCIRDVAVTKKTYRALQHQLKADLKDGTDWRRAIDLEHKTARVVEAQRRHGFRLDVPAAEALAEELRTERDELLHKLQDVFPPQIRPDKAVWDWKKRTWHVKETTKPKRSQKRDGVHYTEGSAYTKIKEEAYNPGSQQQTVQRLSKLYGWKPSKFTDAGSPALDEPVLEAMTYPEAQPLRRLLRLNKMLGMIADGKSAWLKLERNGYVHGAVNTCGAVTGRMTHFSPNMAQVDKKDLRMRAVWLPDPGHKLVGSDAEGLELRMLAHYLAKWDGGAYAETVVSGNKEDGTDPHTKTQKLVGLHKRDNAKALMYAFLYGAGDAKLGATIRADAAEAGVKLKGSNTALGKKARASLEEGITGLDRLIAICKRRSQRPGWLPGLDGRRTLSRSPHSSLNTLLQGAGAVVMKQALVIFHYQLIPEAGLLDQFHYCANVHDEVQLSVVPKHAEQVGQLFGKAIELAGVELGLRCPLSGAYDVGKNWQETH